MLEDEAEGRDMEAEGRATDDEEREAEGRDTDDEERDIDVDGRLDDDD